MTAARILRLARKLTKSLRLLRNSHQLAVTEQNIAYLEDAQVGAAELAKKAVQRRSQLAARRIAIETEDA